MEKEEEYLLEVIKYILHNRKTDFPIPPSDLNWPQLIKKASRHSISNLLFYAVENLDAEHRPEESVYKYLQQQTMKEFVRSCNQLAAADELLAEFEKRKIYVLALKGVNTKNYYPEPDMRSMNDLDLLYKDSQHGMIDDAMQKLGYGGFQEGRKHDHYFRAPYIGVELHREMVASESEYSDYYADIWNRVHSRGGCSYVQEMRREDEYIFTIIHLVEHFKQGGVGLRFMMDVFVYEHLEGMDWDYIEKELEKLHLSEFVQNLSKLAEQWFGTEEQEKDTLVEKLGEYILQNGTYGSEKNAAALAVEQGGRMSFLLKAVFPNLKSMQSMYPWLKKYPILLPWSWMLRGLRSFLYRRGNIESQMKVYKNGDKDYGKELRQFYKQCGL